MSRKLSYEELELMIEELKKEAIAHKRIEDELRDSLRQVEKTLMKLQEQEKRIFNEALDGIALADAETGILIDCNNTLLELVGREKFELTGKSQEILHPPDEGDITVSETFEQQRTGKEGQILETRVITKSGEIKAVEIKTNMIELNNKKVLLGTFRDISHRKRSEDELQESEKRYRNVLENIEDGYYEVDLRGNLTFFNESMCRMLGYPREELMGMNYQEYMGPETAKEVYKVFNGVYTIGKPAKGCDWAYIKKDGTEIYVETSLSLIIDEYGEATGFRGVLRDVTERKMNEKALRESEEKYRTILESIEESYFECDLNGDFTFFNDRLSMSLGYAREELMGMNNRDFMTPESAMKVYKLFNQTYRTGNPIKQVTYEVIRKDGSHAFHELSASLMRDNTGQPIGFRGIARDITELKIAEEDKERLEAQLHHAQRMESIGTLAGGIAHNFNNLLMGIQGNASLLLFQKEPSDPDCVKLNRIQELVRNGSRLTDQLLGYARGGSYEVKLINLNRLVRETSDTFGSTKKDIKIHQELDENLRGITADQGQIEQTLLNMYVNAADAMPNGGDLFLKTNYISHEDIKDKPYKPKPGNYVLLTVRDTGIGMDKKTMERIFEPFFTTKGLAGKGIGTGLGMASAYGIIKSHGGYIDVDSEVGRGTTFEVYIPVSDEVIKEEKEEASHEIVKGSGTILLVDDEEMVIDVGEQMLKKLGYNVMFARDGKEAVDIYQKNRDDIDVVILDVVMPEMGGSEAFNRMKDIDPDIKVLISSGFDQEGPANQMLKRGCKGFIQKPFSMNYLSQKLKDVMELGAQKG